MAPETWTRFRSKRKTAQTVTGTRFNGWRVLSNKIKPKNIDLIIKTYDYYTFFLFRDQVSLLVWSLSSAIIGASSYIFTVYL